MSKFVLYARIDGGWADFAEFDDKEGFVASIERYFDMKRAEGKELDDADAVLGLFAGPCLVLRKKFGLVKRALSRHSEIGFAAELADAIDAAKGEGADAVGWGADDMEEVPPYDFGDMVV